ncbi:MAG: phospholipid-binding protein MlaC [Granulosicoccus sp.]
MYKNLVTALAAIVLSLSSYQVSAEDHPAQTLVVDSITSMLDVLKNEEEKIKSDPEFLQGRVDELIVPNLDFNTMTKLAVGKFWRKADAGQRTELVVEFKTLLLNTYTGALAEYSGESINFEPFRPEDREDRAVVRSTFTQSAGSDVPVIYKLREKDGWSIYDIEVNSISLVTSYRSAFTNEIDKGGIAGLIETLKERNNRS